MKKLLFLMLVSLTTTASFAQKKITIKGRFESLSSSKSLLINNTRVAINEDGSFVLEEDIDAPYVALIRTDSSGATAIWMEEGAYTLLCKEVKRDRFKTTLMRTSVLSGPQDATIYNDFENAFYDGFKNYIKKDTNATTKENQRKAVTGYIDSIISKYPNSKVLPTIIRSAKHAVSNEGMKSFISKLSPSLQQTDEIKQLLNGIKRNETITREIAFENFSMKTMDGKEFTLSDIKGKKLILIDFWASDCGPCRVTHPRLIELYKKYADKGLEIVSVSIDDNRDAWLKAIKDDKIEPWIHVSELKNWETSLIKKYAIPFIPFRFLLDGNYKILSHDDDGQIVVTAGTVEAELKKMGL